MFLCRTTLARWLLALAGLKIGVVPEGFALEQSHAEVDAKVRQAAIRLAELGQRSTTFPCRGTPKRAPFHGA